jgi:glycosyltransferase involved in cell wall biosynthesis
MSPPAAGRPIHAGAPDPADGRHDVICLSSIDWDLLWQGHHEIAVALAARGHRVLFVENTGVRRPGLRDVPRLLRRVRNWQRGAAGGFRRERENLDVCSPLLLPFPYSSAARRINRALLLRTLRAWTRSGSRPGRPIVWTFLPTPLIHDLIPGLSPALTVYYCVNDFAASSPAAQRITPSETRLFEGADLVFTTSEALRARAARSRDDVHLFPFGVNFRMFQEARQAAAALPAELQAFRRPIVGYLGGVHRWVDQDLLVAVAARMPEASFVLVGPVQTEVSRLARSPNVHLLGARPHARVPDYIKGFDVGLIPYRLAPYTADVYPAKLNEYLAMGIPVVATDLPAIRRFKAEHGPVVAVGHDADAFTAAIREAENERTPATIDRRIEVARANRWDERIARMLRLLDARLRASAGGRSLIPRLARNPAATTPR